MRCKTCNDTVVLAYHGQIVTCADCSDGLTPIDYIGKLQEKIKILEAALEFYSLRWTESEFKYNIDSFHLLAQKALKEAKELG